MHVHNPSAKPLFDELTTYLNDSDMTHVKQIVEEIQQRIRRFERTDLA